MLKSMHLDLHLEIDNWGMLKTKLYDKLDFFTFPIVNFPFKGNNIRTPQAYGVYISQLIHYSRAGVQYRAQLLTLKLLKQGYADPRLKSSIQKLYVVITICFTVSKYSHQWIYFLSSIDTRTYMTWLYK